MKSKSTLKIVALVLVSTIVITGASVFGAAVYNKEKTKFEPFFGQYIFSSGAGGWATSVSIKDDGSFEGKYSDSELGSEPYPEVYYQRFKGKFKDLKKIDDYRYSATIGEFKCLENTEGSRYDKNENGEIIKTIFTKPSGISENEEVIFYLKGCPMENVESMYTYWAENYMGSWGENKTVLKNPGFYCKGQESGFVLRSKLREVSFKYNDTYHEDGDPLKGTAYVKWSADLFKKTYINENDRAIAAAAIAAAACDSEIGKGEYLIDAYKALGAERKNISLFSYPKNPLNEKNLKTTNTKDNEFAYSIALINMEEFDLIIMNLRGTQDQINEGLGDATAHLSKKPFYEYTSYKYYWDFKESCIRGLEFFREKNKESFKHEKVKFLIVGHSLGGASAGLTAVQLINDRMYGAQEDDIYCYTFGALNNITQKYEYNSKYSNIENYFNKYDTFGPNGEGFYGFKPTDGDWTYEHKIGNIQVFDRDFTQVFKNGDMTYANHNMEGYLDYLEHKYGCWGLTENDTDKQ